MYDFFFLQALLNFLEAPITTLRKKIKMSIENSARNAIKYGIVKYIRV